VRLQALLRSSALAGAAVALGAATSVGRGRELDREAFERLRRPRGRTATSLALAVTELGSIWASAGAAAILAAAGRRRAAARGLAAASAAWLLGQGMKRTFLRPRPYLVEPDRVRPWIDPPRATSWPSSHPMVLLAFVSVAGRELGAGRIGRAMLSGLAGGVGLTRAYVGVHYPSDVAGGLLLGRAVASVVNGSAH
jgi:membrane-associated phospholipid phosphatase